MLYNKLQHTNLSRVLIWHSGQRITYHIAEHFYGNKIFMEKTFTDCLLVLLKYVMPPKFRGEKTCANSHKTLKFTKVFFHESVPLYGMSPVKVLVVDV